jgi:hypothetical protein
MDASYLVVLFSLYLLSGWPLLVRCVVVGVLAASLLLLYRISGVPFFLVGPATVDDVFAVEVVGTVETLGGPAVLVVLVDVLVVGV